MTLPLHLPQRDAPVANVLHPGDVACGEQGDSFETLLGSCVAVVLTDPRRTAGAMCHIVHAAPAPEDRPTDTRYSDAALAEMFARLRARGLQPQLCEAYLYGGGNMFPEVYPNLSIGERNVTRVCDQLRTCGVRVLHHEVGGAAYRRLRWTVGPGAPQVTTVDL